MTQRAANGLVVVPPHQEKREAHVRRAKTLWLCLLPLLLFAAGVARASAAGERDVALLSFSTNPHSQFSPHHTGFNEERSVAHFWPRIRGGNNLYTLARSLIQRFDNPPLGKPLKMGVFLLLCIR